MSPEAQTWLDERAVGFLERAGVEAGHTVLDFGCHKGNYIRAAAEAVGPSGRVYALDKDQEVLDEVCPNSRPRDSENVKCLRVVEDAPVPLPPCSVDVVLMYDILHRGYLPETHQREVVLKKAYRVLKPGGLLSLYPTHLKQYGMTFDRILREVTTAGFSLRDETRRRLVHDGALVRGRIFSFTRNGPCTN
jgi:ubiquinone/menaquinone biosynthesis C-methylase UbiE